MTPPTMTPTYQVDNHFPKRVRPSTTRLTTPLLPTLQEVIVLREEKTSYESTMNRLQHKLKSNNEQYRVSVVSCLRETSVGN